MAGLVLCEPTDLYNILNQYTTRVSKLSESNYLCLIDARTKAEYDESHVFTAKRAKRDENGEFVIPACVEVECMKYCIVYDGNTSSVHGYGPAIECAEVLALSTRHPVQILKGGYEDFSASYPFLRTQKILYTPQELENLTLYPVEILSGQLYMANLRQASDRQIHKDLKIKALVNASQDSSHVFKGSDCEVFDIPVADSVEADLSGYFQNVCMFIESHLRAQGSVLVFSRLGISRCSAVTMAFLVHHLKATLKESWAHVLKCKTNARPNRRFVQQLSDWELRVLGERATDIAEPLY